MQQQQAAAMSRHRNIGGWVAETYDEDDGDDYGEAETIPVDAYVMAKFYDEDQFYPGTVIDYSEYGYMILFEGYEEDGAQDTDPRDVELVRLPGEGGDECSSSAAIDLESFNDLAAEVASVLEGEVTDSDIRAALEASSFKLEAGPASNLTHLTSSHLSHLFSSNLISLAATTSLLDWVAAGKPGGTFAKKVAKKKKLQTAGAQTPQKTSGGGGGGGGGEVKQGLASAAKAQKPGKEKGKEKSPAKPKEAAKAKKAAAPAPQAGDAGGLGGAGTWTVTREMDLLGLGGSSEAASGVNESVESEEAFDDVTVSAEEDEGDKLDTIRCEGRVKITVKKWGD